MTSDLARREAQPPLGIPMAEAMRFVEHLGFLDVHGTAPQSPGGANLVVALRERPSLEHFDPERIEYWIAHADRGRPAEITRKTAMPVEQPFEWGTIRVVDRLEVSNSFLTFGGTLRAAAVDASTTLVVFSSHAPILRSSGHSQQIDLSAGEVGAFFAEMIVPVHFMPGAEQRVAASTAMAVYAAFHVSAAARYEASEELRLTHPGFAAWCVRERRRLAAAFPADWEAGRTLARELGLERP
jgi:hypothetical protein